MAARIVLALALAASGVLLVVFERSLRHGEVLIAAGVNRLLLGDVVTVGVSDTNPFFGFGSALVGYSIILTVECAVALYLALLLVIGAGLALIRRLRVWRVLLSLSFAAFGMVLLNQLRLLLLEVALRAGGKPVFEWVHSLVGSTMMLVGLCACLFLFFRTVVADSRVRGPRHARSVS